MILTNVIALTTLIISVIIIIIVVLIKGLILSKHKFECSECNKQFFPKWYQVMFETHFNDYFKIKCPHCGKKKYHRVLNDKM